MPTETFSNLPQEKKDKIVKAIQAEFARVPFDKVSINRIVQDADISRGSIYMYFKDKKDMLVYILSSYNDEVKSIIKESFRQNNGDIFAVFVDMIKFTAEFGMAKENISFCMNIFSNQTVHSEIFTLCKGRRKNGYFDLFKQGIDAKSLNLQSSDDVGDMIDILISVTQKAIVDIFLYVEEKDVILKEYLNKITILKRGMLKEKNNADIKKH